MKVVLTSLFRFLFVIMALSATGVAAQTGTDAREYMAIVIEPEVTVRCGAGTNYYSFGALKEGDVVKVVGDLYNFARLSASGRAFREFYGLVAADSLQFAADGASAMTLGMTIVYAPNRDREAMPSQSWQRLSRVEASTRMNVLGRIEEAGKVFHRVTLPANAEGWVPERALRRATAEEVAAYNARRDEPARPSETRAEEPTRPVRTPEPPVTQPETPVVRPTEPVRTPEETTPAVPPVRDDTPPTPPVDVNEERTVVEPPAETPGTPGTPVTPAAPAAPVGPGKPPVVERFESLERSYETLMKEPIRTAEIEPLINQYRGLAGADDADERVTAFANVRVELLRIRLDLQERMRDLDRLRTRADMSQEESAAARLALDRSGDYDAVGRLTASTVYTGVNLPRLLRIVDPTSGRTVAYVEPDDRFDYAGMIGQIVGLSGAKSYDAGLRLTLVKPRRIEMLTTVGN